MATHTHTHTHSHTHTNTDFLQTIQHWFLLQIPVIYMLENFIDMLIETCPMSAVWAPLCSSRSTKFKAMDVMGSDVSQSNVACLMFYKYPKFTKEAHIKVDFRENRECVITSDFMLLCLLVNHLLFGVLLFPWQCVWHPPLFVWTSPCAVWILSQPLGFRGQQSGSFSVCKGEGCQGWLIW